jgi:hypothetical protein
MDSQTIVLLIMPLIPIIFCAVLMRSIFIRKGKMQILELLPEYW